MANHLSIQVDYSSALELLYPLLERFEKRKDDYGQAVAYGLIAITLSSCFDFEQSAKNSWRAIDLAERINSKRDLGRFHNALGVTYSLSGKPDSGIFHANKAIEIFGDLKDSMNLSVCYSTLAENYLAAKDYAIAIPILRKAEIVYAKPTSFIRAWFSNDYAEAYMGLNNHDSAEYYLRNSISLCNDPSSSEQLLRAYEFMHKLFESKGNSDSAYRYYRAANMLMDSIFSMEKARTTQALLFREELRQKNKAEELRKAEEDRRHYIEYGLIAIGIITFSVFFVLLSRSVIVNERWISFLGALGLLVVFEFINLLLHPTLVNLTGDSPFLMLLSLVSIAAVLIPLHHRIERKVKERMTEKNKRIRLEHAKKTIEELGG